MRLIISVTDALSLAAMRGAQRGPPVMEPEQVLEAHLHRGGVHQQEFLMNFNYSSLRANEVNEQPECICRKAVDETSVVCQALVPTRWTMCYWAYATGSKHAVINGGSVVPGKKCEQNVEFWCDVMFYWQKCVCHLLKNVCEAHVHGNRRLSCICCHLLVVRWTAVTSTIFFFFRSFLCVISF